MGVSAVSTLRVSEMTGICVEDGNKDEAPMPVGFIHILLCCEEASIRVGKWPSPTTY